MEWKSMGVATKLEKKLIWMGKINIGQLYDVDTHV